MASLAQPALMPITPQSTSTALNQPTAARSRPSWPRRTARRGNTAPVPQSDPAQNDPFDSPTSTEPNQLRGRVATEPILRNGTDALHPVKIGAYRLSWDKLRPYLEKQFQRTLPRTIMAADNFTVWLPREPNTTEWADIDDLRLKDANQQQRIDRRPDVTPGRPLDSDEEDEQ